MRLEPIARQDLAPAQKPLYLDMEEGIAGRTYDGGAAFEPRVARQARRSDSRRKRRIRRSIGSTEAAFCRSRFTASRSGHSVSGRRRSRWIGAKCSIGENSTAIPVK
jgi:hypothetical protein